MATYLRMPGLSADAEDAILIDWLVETGASLAKGDLVATVETDKANVDIECDRAATVYRLLVPAGATVPVGDPIALSPPAGSFGQAVLGVVGTYTTVAFLQAADEGFEMWGAVLQCGN